MKCLLPYSALAAGGLGFISWILTFFFLPSCYIALGFFVLSEVLFIICIVKGACCCARERKAATQE